MCWCVESKVHNRTSGKQAFVLRRHDRDNVHPQPEIGEGLELSGSGVAPNLRRTARGRHPLDTSVPESNLVLIYANRQRYLSKHGPERQRYSDPDASWGHRSAVSTRKGGGFYGYRVHAAVCTHTDLPVAWQVETAGSHESN